MQNLTLNLIETLKTSIYNTNHTHNTKLLFLISYFQFSIFSKIDVKKKALYDGFMTMLLSYIIQQQIFLWATQLNPFVSQYIHISLSQRRTGRTQILTMIVPY